MSGTATKKHYAFKEKKELTPKQQKLKTIGNWIANVICIIFIVFSLVVAVFTIVRSTNEKRLTDFGGKIYMSVQSDSMAPTFSKDDMIICNEYNGNGADLKVGQVITYVSYISIGGKMYESYNTHRIVSIKNEGTTNAIFTTQGDAANAKYAVDSSQLSNNGKVDSATQTASKIVATWGSVNEDGTVADGKVLNGMGAMSNWLQDPEKGKTRFFLAIVLPLILLFVAYAYVLIRTLIIAKLAKENKVNTDGTSTVDALSEDDKKRLAKEYLASLNKSSKDISSLSADVLQEENADIANTTDNGIAPTENGEDGK